MSAFAELDKAKLLALTVAEYELIGRTLGCLTPEQMMTLRTEGEWTPRDMLCHLVRWLDRLRLWVADAERGVKPAMPEAGYTWRDMDALNDVYVEQDKSVPLARSLAGFERAHTAALALIERLTEQQLFVSTFDGALDEPIADLAAECTYRHYAYHARNLRDSLLAQGVLSAASN